jgi:NAD(P)-dependent dehydrogenase (short-subunit alcohol dehydrogenase family)
MTPPALLKGKTAIVTGAGRGIGRAIARRLSAAGADVAVTARTEPQLDETRRLIERAGGNVLAMPADVANERDVERLIEAVMERFGRIDVLVNNAGTAPLARIDEMEPDVFDHTIATNIRSVYLCSRAVWGIMAEAGEGIIVNISSLSAYDPFPGFAAYGAAKAFVNLYTTALAAEGKSRGIRLYGVAPGAVETEMLRGAFPDFPAEKTLAPDDVAQLVETLLTPACRFISGQVITIKKQ